MNDYGSSYSPLSDLVMSPLSVTSWDSSIDVSRGDIPVLECEVDAADTLDVADPGVKEPSLNSKLLFLVTKDKLLTDEQTDCVTSSGDMWIVGVGAKLTEEIRFLADF